MRIERDGWPLGRVDYEGLVEELGPWRSFRDAVKQRWERLRAARPRSVSCADVQRALAWFPEIEGRPDEGDGSEPVFVLAAGWRTGSTLLQRILMTDPQLCLWSEPMGRMAPFPRLTESILAIDGTWPSREWTTGSPDASDDLGVARQMPCGSDLRAGWRSWLRTWLADPAALRGRPRWGLKEVRLGAADACVLRWLFPRARVVALVRHPYAAYRSCKYWTLYDRWPDVPVDSAASYGRHWARLAGSWLEGPDVPPALLVRYEDLLSGSFDFRELEQDLGLHLEEDRALDRRVGATRDGHGLTRSERNTIAREAGSVMERFGYRR